MSIINATLVAQAIHFLIAYLLIRYLFFKPIYEQIEKEDTLQESLINTIQSHQQQVIQKEQKLADQWHALKNYFASHVRLSSYIPLSRHQPEEIQIPHLKSENIKKAILTATHEIIKKVNHV